MPSPAMVIMTAPTIMIVNPIAMACAYAGLGAVVGLSHLIFPKPEENSWKANAQEPQLERELLAA